MRITHPSRKSISISFCAALGLVFAMTVIANANFITDGSSNTFLDGSVRFRGFDSMLAVSDNGHRVFVTGKVNCTAGQKVQILARLTQRSTGALAEGSWKGECTGHLQVWQTEAVSRGEAKFENGASEAVAFGVSSENGKTTDVLQWLDDVTVVQGIRR